MHKQLSQIKKIQFQHFDKVNNYGYELGQSLYYLEKYQEAMDSFDKALNIDPKNDKFYYFKGNALYQLKLYTGALSLYNKAIQLKADEASYYFNQATTFCQLMLCQEGLPSSDFKIEPSHQNFSQLKGILFKINSKSKGISLQQRYQYQKALQIYQQILESEPNNQEILQNKQKCLMILNES
ncbi:hypothetical protein pb186bvf_002094 [Paramecium bursaria]